MLKSRRVLILFYTLRRAALASRTTTTYHIQQLCPMNDCNGRRELVTRTLRRAALTCRITTTCHTQQLVVSNVKESWSQGHYVEQHSRAELQLRTIYISCVQCKRELVTRILRIAALASRTTTTYHIQQLCPMNDCNGKGESVTRTLRRAALTKRTTITYHIQ